MKSGIQEVQKTYLNQTNELRARLLAYYEL